MLLVRHPEPLAGCNHTGRRLLQERQRQDQSPAQTVHRKAVGEIYYVIGSPSPGRSPKGTPGSAQRIPC